jgi:hypothetical protein
MHFQAYDSFGAVHWSLSILDEDEPDDSPTRLVRLAGDILGQGHPLWPHWLRDILEDAREAL